jgi:hypothetical protein
MLRRYDYFIVVRFLDARDLCRTQYARIRFFWIDVSSTREGEEILANVECNRNQRTRAKRDFCSSFMPRMDRVSESVRVVVAGDD